MVTCPTSCGRSVDHGKLMCPGCWREVPKPLQRDVNRTWSAYQLAHRTRVGLGGNDEIREARLAYQAARDAAIGSIP